MAEMDYSSSKTEAVAVFHSVQSFQAAIDDLMLAGCDIADINVLAHEDTVTSKLGRAYKSTAEFEDHADVPRIGWVPVETIGDAEGAVVGTGIYVPAIAGSLAVAASGGTILGAFAAAVIAGGTGALIGVALARFIGDQHQGSGPPGSFFTSHLLRRPRAGSWQPPVSLTIFSPHVRPCRSGF
jgi:hypothetical protein